MLGRISSRLGVVSRRATAARCVRPAVAMKSVATPSIRLAPVRVLSTDAKAEKEVVAASEPAEEAVVEQSNEQGGILGRGYEKYPTLALLATAACTQEWIIPNEWYITAGCLTGVVYLAYISFGDAVIAAKKVRESRRVAQWRAAFGIRADMLKRYQLLEEFSLSHADELRNLYGEEAKISQMAVDYQNLKHKLDTRNAVVAKLKSIQVLEDDARRQAIAALSKKASEYVQTAYVSAPPAVKQRQIENAITAIAPELTTKSIALMRSKPVTALASDDPIKLLFDEFLSQPRTFEQLGVENYVSKFMARKASAH